MTVVCLHVKPTASSPGTGLMTVTLHGPRWTGERLRVMNPGLLGLEHGDLVGWSDFYGGGPCPVQVAYATDGRHAGYLVWGGTLGLRAVPPHLDRVGREHADDLEARALLWIDDPGMLPAEVRVAVGATRGVSRSGTPGSLQEGPADRLPVP